MLKLNSIKPVGYRVDGFIENNVWVQMCRQIDNSLWVQVHGQTRNKIDNQIQIIINRQTQFARAILPFHSTQKLKI